MLTDREINDFIVNHSGSQWFDVDLKLYKERFPRSLILKALEEAQEFQKKELNERMIAELLRDGGQCIDCILENRGYYRDKDGFIVPMQKEGELNEFEKQLLEIDLDKKTDYNTLKAIIFGLEIHTSDAKHKTYIEALRPIKAKLTLISAKAEGSNDTTDSEGAAGAANTTASEGVAGGEGATNTTDSEGAAGAERKTDNGESEKKSEDLEENTQK